MMKLAGILAVILIFLSPVACGESSPLATEETALETVVTVSRVVDGDTVEISPAVDGEEDLRLIGVDTPEMFGDFGPQPLAEEASDFTMDNLSGRNVRLEFDEERIDDYGRLLAYIHLENGEMFNETLLREGYAQVATFPPNTRHLEDFEEAQREARRAGLGIWSLPPQQACLLRDRGNGLGGGC